MTEHFAQVTVEFTQRDSGFRNLDLDIVAPEIREGLRIALQIRLSLHDSYSVQQFRGDDLAREAARGKVGRHGERLDHQTAAVVSVPDHESEPGGNDKPGQRNHRFQRDGEALIDDTELHAPDLVP